MSKIYKVLDEDRLLDFGFDCKMDFSYPFYYKELTDCDLVVDGGTYQNPAILRINGINIVFNVPEVYNTIKELLDAGVIKEVEENEYRKND